MARGNPRRRTSRNPVRCGNVLPSGGPQVLRRPVENAGGRSPRLALGLAADLASAAVCSVAPSAMAQSTWVGDTSTDWNNAANWSSDPAAPTGNFFIETNTANIATINANSAYIPVDVFVGSVAG